MPPPKARVCYICGRQYMVHSFDIHITQCRELFEKREALKPAKERRRCPDDPMKAYDSIYPKQHHSMNIDDINDLSFQSFNNSLMPCRLCGRTFLPEKLNIHQKSCKPGKSARPSPLTASSKSVSFGAVEESQQRDRDNSSYNSSNHSNYSGGALSSSSTSNAATRFLTEGSFVPAELMQCPSCGRSFNEFSYKKHVNICKKVFVNKRKVYDSAKHRAEGTDLMQFRKKASAKYPSYSSSNSNSNSNHRQQQQQAQQSSLPKWKADSLAFRAAMRAAKTVSRAEAVSKKTGIPLHALLPPASSSSTQQDYATAGYITCPTCHRSFNEKAGSRHIPQCKNIINKPKALVKGSGVSSAGIAMYSTTGSSGGIGSTWSQHSADYDYGDQQQQHFNSHTNGSIASSRRGGKDKGARGGHLSSERDGGKGAFSFNDDYNDYKDYSAKQIVNSYNSYNAGAGEVEGGSERAKKSTGAASAHLSSLVSDGNRRKNDFVTNSIGNNNINKQSYNSSIVNNRSGSRGRSPSSSNVSNTLSGFNTSASTGLNTGIGTGVAGAHNNKLPAMSSSVRSKTNNSSTREETGFNHNIDNIGGNISHSYSHSYSHGNGHGNSNGNTFGVPKRPSSAVRSGGSRTFISRGEDTAVSSTGYGNGYSYGSGTGTGTSSGMGIGTVGKGAAAAAAAAAATGRGTSTGTGRSNATSLDNPLSNNSHR